MITPSIKTNLILKEMGITRYELRSKQQSDLSKTIFSYQKGNILTLLEQSYDDLGKDEAELLNAIVDAVNSVNEDTIQNKFNLEDAKKIILATAKLPDGHNDSEHFIDQLLHDKHIFLAPGTIFGSAGQGYIRFSLCIDKGHIVEALNRLEK